MIRLEYVDGRTADRIAALLRSVGMDARKVHGKCSVDVIGSTGEDWLSSEGAEARFTAWRSRVMEDPS